MSEFRLHYHRLWLGVGCLLIGTVIVLSLIPDPVTIPVFDVSDKFEHLFAYAVLMGWFGQLYRRPMLRLGYAFSFVLLGVVLEFAQRMEGTRSFEIADMVADGCGVALAWLILRWRGDRLLLWFERRVMGLAPTPSEPRESP